MSRVHRSPCFSSITNCTVAARLFAMDVDRAFICEMLLAAPPVEECKTHPPCVCDSKTQSGPHAAAETVVSSDGECV